MKNQEILNQIKARRKSLGKTQQEVAKCLHITSSSYSRLENGKSSFTVEQLKTVCDYLSIKFEDLYSQLPQPAKPALISADEYIRLTNKMLEMQTTIDDLNKKLNSSNDNHHIANYLKNKTSIFAFFQSLVESQASNDNSYSPDWQSIAKAAKLKSPETFLERYKDYKIACLERFIKK